jgi:hypothetical protein
MTTLEALKYSVNYPLTDKNVLPLVKTRGLTPEAEFTQSIGTSTAYKLAYADCLRFVVTMVNLQQGGSVTQAAVKALEGTANAIYKANGEPLIGEVADAQPTVTILEDF